MCNDTNKPAYRCKHQYPRIYIVRIREKVNIVTINLNDFLGLQAPVHCRVEIRQQLSEQANVISDNFKISPKLAVSFALFGILKKTIKIIQEIYENSGSTDQPNEKKDVKQYLYNHALDKFVCTHEIVRVLALQKLGQQLRIII